MAKKPIRMFFISLGCPKNLVDSEVMLGRLVQENFHLCADPDDAEVAIVNTCSFIDDARVESTEVINEMLAAKEAGTLKAVVVTGCWPEHEKQKLVDEFPGVNLFAGFAAYPKLGEHIRKTFKRKKSSSSVFQVRKQTQPLTAETARLRVTPRHYAYLRVADGCSNTCSFCVIPRIRGRFRSKKPSDVLAEAKELAADGVKELIIIAQDTTSYGKDLDGRKAKEGLAGLLRKMAEIDRIEWIRVLYGHPATISDELLDVFAGEHKIVKYLDLPLQHVSDNVLGAMRRKTTGRETGELIERIRRRVPGIALRTSLIAGFPGETEKDFCELVGFVKGARFERLGVFQYSREPGTGAAELPGQVPDDVKAARFNELSELQEKIMLEYHKSLAGEIVPVIIDSDAGEEDKAGGRTFADAPDIDPVILLEGADTDAGKTGLARIAGLSGLDLTGEFIESE